MKKKFSFFLMNFLLIVNYGCGQSGPLYLPEENKQEVNKKYAD